LDEPAQVDISNFFGLITCQILPPAVLKLPVLPCRFNNKLYFALCKICMTEDNRDFCTHTDEERSYLGTWGIPELELAIEKGYTITR
jgi:hypothetical protein